MARVWYNSLQVAVNKRYSHGLTAHCRVHALEEPAGAELPEPAGRQPARSLVPWDRTHRLVLAPIYELPFGPGKRFLGKTGPCKPADRGRLAVDA